MESTEKMYCQNSSEIMTVKNCDEFVENNTEITGTNKENHSENKCPPVKFKCGIKENGVKINKESDEKEEDITYKELKNSINIITNQKPSKKSCDFYRDFKLNFGEMCGYKIVQKIGVGRFGQVYEGFKEINGEKVNVVAKIIKPSENIIGLIKKEAYILSSLLYNSPNITKLLDICKNNSALPVYTMIFNSIQGQDLKSYIFNNGRVSLKDIKIYMYKILKGISSLHSKNIMHRDIKLANIIINSTTKEVNIIDFGLSDIYVKETKYGTRVGSRAYKAPELLVGYGGYDCRVDMWSLGCVFGALIFGVECLFKSTDDKDQLLKISEILGYFPLSLFLNKHKITLKISKEFELKLRNLEEGLGFSAFINDKNKETATPDALDLLGKMLKFDFEERISAQSCLGHEFFREVREKEK